MNGETGLAQLLANMQPELQPGEFVFCTVDQQQAAAFADRAVCLFREAEGVTLILPRQDAERAGIAYTFASRMITLRVHSSLEAVGFLARITAALASEGISTNAISAYYHDHLYVAVADAARAMEVLVRLQRSSAIA